jgi:hypothetical protein
MRLTAQLLASEHSYFGTLVDSVGFIHGTIIDVRTRTMRLITLALLLLIPVAAYGQTAAPAQTAKPTPNEAKTTLETFQAKTGVVIVKGFSRLGTMRGIGGTVEVSSREFTDAQTGKKAYGIVVEVRESGRLERSNRSYVDYEEIDSLVKGIDYIAKMDNTVTKMDSFEAQYSTKGDLSITVFNDAEGLQVGITTGKIGATSAFFKLSELPSFRKLLTDAKLRIDAIRTGA